MGTDYAARVIGVPVARRLINAGPQLSLDMSPLSDGSFKAVERARIDLILHAGDGHIPTISRAKHSSKSDSSALSPNTPTRLQSSRLPNMLCKRFARWNRSLWGHADHSGPTIIFIVPNSGHWLLEEQPATVAAKLQAFLAAK